MKYPASAIQTTKEIVSKRLSEIPDQSFAGVLRYILFSDTTDWDRVARELTERCPEVKF